MRWFMGLPIPFAALAGSWSGVRLLWEMETGAARIERLCGRNRKAFANGAGFILVCLGIAARGGAPCRAGEP